jgi:glycerol-3-phosphate dehydrogenase
MIHPVDGRVLFTLPGGEVTIFGTTETPTDASPRDVRATREDVRYLLDAANHYYPRASLGESDVVSAWAGIRPLATRLVRGSAGSASREHTIEVGAHGVLHVTGGKLTTYREMAAQVVDRAVAALRRAAPAVRARRAATARVPLPGGELTSFDDTRAEAAAAAGDRGVGGRLASAYGARWRDVWSLTRARPALAESLGNGRTLAEAAHAVEREQACTLADVLVRRLRLAFELPDRGAAAAARVCDAVPALAVPDAGSALDAYAADVEHLLGVAGEAAAIAE